MPDFESLKWLWQTVYGWFGAWGIATCALFAAAVFIYTRWSTVTAWPGISTLVAYLRRKRLPQADPHRFSVAVAHLEDDDAGRTHEKLIVRLLQEFEGIQVLAFDRTISVHGTVPEEQERKGHETARQYLKASNASVVIWGRVLHHADQSKPDLYLTAAAGQDGRSRQYTLETGMEFSLPEVFWDDLADILRLVIVTQATQFEEGHYIADRLRPFITRVRTLLEASAGRPGWNAKARASAQFVLATALSRLGEQSGQAEPLKEAVALYRAVLEERTRARAPLDWAMTQNNLGTALGRLGERDSGTDYLEEAVEAFRAALEELTRDRMPLDWARTKTNLGNALLCLGERESGTARLEKAIESFRAALTVRTRDRMPLDWATTQNSLGGALAALGERESDTARLKEAVEAFRATLAVWTRKRMPLQWAATQNNFGAALSALGERESGTARLKQAVKAYRAALEEQTRECVPLDWARTQINLGNALWTLGERTGQPRLLREALDAITAAREVYQDAGMVQYEADFTKRVKALDAVIVALERR